MTRQIDRRAPAPMAQMSKRLREIAADLDPGHETITKAANLLDSLTSGSVAELVERHTRETNALVYGGLEYDDWKGHAVRQASEFIALAYGLEAQLKEAEDDAAVARHARDANEGFFETEHTRAELAEARAKEAIDAMRIAHDAREAVERERDQIEVERNRFKLANELGWTFKKCPVCNADMMVASGPAALAVEEDRKAGVRLHWLHNNADYLDAEGYEWGIYRVRWNRLTGVVESVQQTLSDFSDLDAALAEKEQKT